MQKNVYNVCAGKIIIENWRVEHDTFRPHSSLNVLTPERFAKEGGERNQQQKHRNCYL